MAKKSATTKKPENIVATVVNDSTGYQITLTPEVIDRAEKLFRTGLKDSAVANVLEINPTLFMEWLTKGAMIGDGLHGQLFRRCAKAIGHAQLSWVAKIIEAGMGTPAEYAYNETTMPDGRVIKELALDGEGKPIVRKREQLANVDHLKWMLEKRFKKDFGKGYVGFDNMLEHDLFDATFKKPNETKKDEKDVTPEEGDTALAEMNHIMAELKNAGVI